METLAQGSVNETPQAYLDKLLTGCREKLDVILPFTKEELEFLVSVNKWGEIKPELLDASGQWCDSVSKHPMLQWKVVNVRKHYGL